MKFRPLHDRVVVERIDAEAMTAGGIIIPDTATEKPQQGKTGGVGPGARGGSGRSEPEPMTAGGIIIPDTAKEKPQQGKIVGVGPGGRDEQGKLIPIDLRVRTRGRL